MKKQQKRMKLPNCFGSIVKLSGRRRKPWAVRKKINGHYKYLGYFVTYEEALIFLSNYNQDPSAYSAQLITFAEIFELELAERIKYKRILGHADKDITSGVYTHKDLRQLKKAIDLL